MLERLADSLTYEHGKNALKEKRKIWFNKTQQENPAKLDAL